MARNSQTSDSKCKCCKDLVKQQALNSQRIHQQSQIVYECQPMLSKHPQCNELCLDFSKRMSNSIKLSIQIQKVQAIPLKKSKLLIESILSQNSFEEGNDNLNQQRQLSKFIKKRKRITCPLNQEQRKQIQELQLLNYKNSIISAILCISTSQVRQNSIKLKIIKSKVQIQITKSQKKWLIEQGSFQSNTILFNAKSFLAAFQNQFPCQQFSLTQFRQILHQLNIRYRIPSLKPLQFFYKTGKEEEMKFFISLICGYIQNNYKLIFIDECSLGNISKSSHKQWHIVGSFKETTHRISSFKYLIGALGEDFFLQYQLISGTGKAYIFQDFLIEIIHKAYHYYKEKKFVLILDNCSIHKSHLVQDIFEQVPCIFTPAYRPEFNAIEHMFGWVKRKIVASQPSVTTQFIFQIHQIMNVITNDLMQNWCKSIFKPMLNELSWI